MITNFKIFFRSDYATLRLAGTWIGPDHKIKPTWYKFYSFACHTNACVFVVSIVINWILNSTSVRGLASLGYVVMTALTGELKGILLLKKQKQAASLFDEYDNEYFQMKDKEEITATVPKLSLFNIIRTALKVGVLVCLVLLVVGPIIFGTVKNLILPEWFPFDVSASPWYQLVYLHQAISLSSIAICNACGDPLMASLCLFIGIQCNLLSMRLIKIGENGVQHKEQLFNCMEHYKHIVMYLHTTNEAFDTVYFLQFFATTTSMCMDLFLLSVVQPGTYEFIFYVAYLLGIMNMLLIPCWFASEMTKSSEDIPFAAYSCDWIDADNRFKKDLNMFICRCQKPLKLYGAKFFEVSVLTFLAVVRASMSYFAVMRNLSTTVQL